MNRSLVAIVVAVASLLGATWLSMAQTVAPTPAPVAKGAPADAKTATFAGGCFWCLESDFDKLPGVLRTTSGYIGGKEPNPTYHLVSSGTTGHAEAVEVAYDPAKVSYEKLVDYFWHHVDPLDAGGQFCDRGRQYRTAIFYHDEQQKKIAEASKKALEDSHRFKEPIATEIVAAGTFTPAEEYHQDYYKKNPIRYAYYRAACGRDHRVEEVWGKATH